MKKNAFLRPCEGIHNRETLFGGVAITGPLAAGPRLTDRPIWRAEQRGRGTDPTRPPNQTSESVLQIRLKAFNLIVVGNKSCAGGWGRFGSWNVNAGQNGTMRNNKILVSRTTIS